MPDLRAIFDRLPTPAPAPTGRIGFSGETIAGTPHHFTKDTLGRPGLLVAVAPHSAHHPPVALRNLRVEHGVRCKISMTDGPRVDGRFSVLQCQSTSASLQDCFLTLAGALLESLTEELTAQDLSDSLQRMTTLFRALERASIRTVQGLWAELFLIHRASDPNILVQSWHADAMERFDFSDDAYRIEVKAAADRTRNHHFSLSQLCAPPGVHILVASMFVERSAGGLSLGELWGWVREQVASIPDMRLRVDEVCFQSLGAEWEEARLIAFDRELAAESLSFYRVEDVPCISSEVPPEVTDVRFRSNLDRAPRIDPASIVSASLFRAIGYSEP